MKEKKIVGVSCEPYGSYHFSDLALRENISLTHLVPDIKGHGGQVFPRLGISDNTGDIANADLVIFCGGHITPYMNEVGRLVNLLGVPAVFVELGYPSKSLLKQFRNEIKLEQVMIINETSRSPYSEAFEIPSDEIDLIRFPALDRVRGFLPPKGREHTLLVLSSVTAEMPNPMLLLDFVKELEEVGIPFEIRLHPRENRDLWRGKPLVSAGYSAAQDIVGRKAVVGYAGTSFMLANWLGVPAFHVGENLTPHGYIRSQEVSSPVELLELAGAYISPTEDIWTRPDFWTALKVFGER